MYEQCFVRVFFLQDPQVSRVCSSPKCIYNTHAQPVVIAPPAQSSCTSAPAGWGRRHRSPLPMILDQTDQECINSPRPAQLSSPFTSASLAASRVELRFGMLPQEPCAIQLGMVCSRRGGAGKLQSEEPPSWGRGPPNCFHCGQRKRPAGEAERVATHTVQQPWKEKRVYVRTRA